MPSGVYPRTEEHNRKIGEANRRRSEESRQKMSEALRGKKNAYKHGYSGSPAYNSYYHMIARCEDPNAAHYDKYGGRGIKVCDRWRQGFLSFLLDMGERPPGKVIHRKDGDGDYEPGNCLWISKRRHGLFHGRGRR